MRYLLSYTQFAWRWFVIAFIMSMIIGQIPEARAIVTTKAGAALWVYVSQFIAWMWYHRRVVERVTIEIVED